MQDRKMGKRVLDLFSDIDYETSAQTYGYKVSEKMNQFEDKNGNLAGINKKVRSSCNTVCNLFFN